MHDGEYGEYIARHAREVGSHPACFSSQQLAVAVSGLGQYRVVAPQISAAVLFGVG